MTPMRTFAVCTAIVVLILSASASSVVAVEFTTSHPFGENWNALYAQGFKASIDPSPDPGHAATDTVHLDRFQFFKSGTADTATDIQLAILNNYFVNLDTLTTSSPELVGLSTNTIASTASIATGSPITFDFDGLPLNYGDPEALEFDNYTAMFVNVDGGGVITPVLVSAMIANYVEDPPGSGTWVPESHYGDPDINYFLSASNWINEISETESYLVTFNAPYADARFIAYFDMEATGLVGDYNGNDVVDAADYTVWRDTLGQTGSGLPADGNGNNEIDAGDYDVWKTNFGMTAGGGAALVAAVPEPASILLVAVAGLALCGVRRRGR